MTDLTEMAGSDHFFNAAVQLTTSVIGG